MECLRKNLSVIGFEECEEDIHTFSRKGITCFQMNTRGMGIEAVSMLMKRIEGKAGEGQAQKKEFDLIFMERESVYENTR